MKVAIYARYSSDNQRDTSIEDQFRICRLHAEKLGWQIVEEYADHAISGASLLRPGIQALIADANSGRFQIVLAKAMDRLSRDQEDIAGLFKRMGYAGVKLVTLSEGEVSRLHVGLKGTMNALFLKDLADKVRRGLRGRVEHGKSGQRIAAELNREGIRAPSGGDWGFSTITGNPKRGTGILNNEMYVGKLIWNRLNYIKNPDTGKRQSRLNPES